MMKIKKNRILKILGISAFGIAPIVLASCSSYSTLLARTVSKGNGTSLDSNISLSGYSEAALKSDTGMKAYIKHISENLIYDWLKRLSDTSNNVTLSNDFKNQKITIDDDYNDLVDSYKDKYGSSAWKLKFQQEVLDPAGGTEQSYKQSKWNDWVTSQFETQLFNKSYLTYKDANNKVVSQDSLANASVSDLYKALQGEKFVFASSEAVSDQNVLTNEKIDNLYADFMQYIWDQYVQIDTPYVVNMVLWKYGTPSQGLGNYYTHATSTTTSSSDSSSDSSSSSGSASTATNSSITQVSTSTHDDSSDSSDSSSTTTATAGSYIYPYFSNSSVGSTEGSLTKYVNFLTGANSATSTTVNVDNIGKATSSQADNDKKQSIPYLASYDTNAYGLTDIPSTLTDDSSTYILAKNSSIYSDLYIEFAAASSYLFWRNQNVSNDVNLSYAASSSAATAADGSSSGYGIPSIDTNIQHAIWSGTTATADTNSTSLPTINGDTTTGLDPITSSFLSSSDIFSSGHQYELKLDKTYVNEILKENGNLNSLRNNDLYVVDSFIPKNYNLTNYIFLRDSAGVHAITIDGYNYINGSGEIGKSSLTTTEKKKRAGQVVLFRSLYNNISSKASGYSFSVDVQSDLKTFYENNIDWLIYSYALSKEKDTSFKLFDLSNLKLTDAEKNAATSINNFLHETANYTKVDDYNNALYKAKATYSANYGVTAYSNGLAAPWTYATFSEKDATTYDSNPTISFQIATASGVVKNPFTTSSASVSAETVTYNYDGSTYVTKDSLYKTISALTTTLTALANSSFDGFRYSQYIYSNSLHVNAALLAFSSEGTDLADLAKIGFLYKYINGKFDFSTMKFTGVTVGTKDISTYLNYAMSNFFFNSTFDSATNKWGKLSSTDNKNWSNAIENSFAVKDTSTDLTKIVEDYKIKLWKRANEVYSSTTITNYLSLYTTVASILYMLENNSSYFLNYLTTQINVGDTAYIAWESSQNSALEKSTNSSTASELLSTTKMITAKSSSTTTQIIKRNINNSFVSSYIGGYNLYYNNSSSNASVATNEDATRSNGPLTISYYPNLPNFDWTSVKGPNLGGSSLYQDSNDAKTYYSISGGMVGFLGLQTSGSNSFNSTVSNLLFTNPTVDNDKGLLYGYESLENLKTIIQGATSLTEINNIASTLGTNLNQKQISVIATDTDSTLAQKKTKLLTAVDNLSGTIGSSSSYFTARNGIVNSDKTSEFNKNGLLSSSTSTNMQYAAYTIQLNRSNLASQDALLNAINTGLSTSTSSGSKDTTSYSDNTYDVFSNLLVQQAVNTTNQSSILSLIIDKQGKIKAYDVRLYTGLGAEWIYDWKVTNTSSSSSSSSSSDSSSSS